MNNLLPILLPVALVAWIVYRRIRRTIGFQRYTKRRLLVRTSILAVIGVLVIGIGVLHPIAYAGDAAGIVAGGLLAYAALRYLNFENRDGVVYYRTHVWVESVVLVLFLGRLAYRFIEAATAGKGSTNGLSQLENPVNAGALLLFACYYIAFSMVLIRRVGQIDPAPTSD